MLSILANLFYNIIPHAVDQNAHLVTDDSGVCVENHISPFFGKGTLNHMIIPCGSNYNVYYINTTAH